MFGRDCRVAFRAPRNDKAGAFRSQGQQGRRIGMTERTRGAFRCSVGIAASRSALLAMTRRAHFARKDNKDGASE
ncbi:MAG: hypothetical protein LBL66_01970 [Clostridiales bacterium]|nr:hypothetical protein [Clostridiales bacterium]